MASTSATDSATTVPSSASTGSTGATSQPGPQGQTEVYFSVADGSDCAAVQAFPRDVPADTDRFRATFDQLVAGPTDDEAASGVGSFFSSETSDVVRSVTIIDGLLLVDFVDLRPLLSNASTSCGSEALLAQLDATAFQFPSVQRVRYQMEGSCDGFANWLQRECFDTDRSGRQLEVATVERASGSGCT
ncbi:MAG: GerMN domain-containing protein, partial [Acidimicrobiales bacterium]